MSPAPGDGGDEAAPGRTVLREGALVVVPSAPGLGLGRVTRWLPAPVDDEGGTTSVQRAASRGGAPASGHPRRTAWVWCYGGGRFQAISEAELRPAPPGVWPPSEGSD